MQIAIAAGGFSPGEADELRRSMAAWRRKGGIGPFHAKLVNGMKAKGYDQDYAEAIFRQLEGFGEYGFPESHSASFAQLAYFSAWLKCHEPTAFLAALLNSPPMGCYSPSQLVQDAQRHGVPVLPVDINTSLWESSLDLPNTASLCEAALINDPYPASPQTSPVPVRLGFNQIKGFSKETALRIEAARRQGPFTD